MHIKREALMGAMLESLSALPDWYWAVAGPAAVVLVFLGHG